MSRYPSIDGVVTRIIRPTKGGGASRVSDLEDGAALLSKVAANTNNLATTTQVLQSDIAQKLDGIVVSDNTNTYHDISGLTFNGGYISLTGSVATVNIEPKVSIANGQTPDSTSAQGNAIIFEGSTIEVDPNDKNVIKVTIPHTSTNTGITLSDGTGIGHNYSKIIFEGADIRVDDTIASVHIPYKHFDSIADRDSWSTKYGSVVRHKVVASVEQDEDGFAQDYIFDASTKKWEEYNSKGVILSDANGAIPKNIKTIVLGSGFSIQQAGDQEDAALVQYTPTSTGGGSPLTVGQMFGKYTSIDNVTNIDTLWPLEVNQGMAGLNQPSAGYVVLSIQPNVYERQHAASCLIQLNADVTLRDGHATKVYMAQEIIPTGAGFSLNKPMRGINVQDNTGGDTALTGGELTRILASVGFYGTATEDCTVTVWAWFKDPASPLAGGILKDVNGIPMVVSKHYNQGDTLTPILLTGAMMATGSAPIVLYVEANAGSFVLDPDKTMMCVEQFSNGYQTSIASIEFQRRLGIAIYPEIKQFTPKMLTLREELAGLVTPEGTIAPHTGYDFLNEFGIQNLTNVKASVKDNTLGIRDNDGDIADFYVDAYLDNIKTTMLRGKTIDYSVTMTNPYTAFALEVYKWTGEPDKAGRVYDSRNNMSLVLNNGFTLVKTKFITEQPDGNARGCTDSVTVPDDAVNLFIILRPMEAQSPMELTLSEFEWGVPQPFKGYREVVSNDLHTQHLWFSTGWAEFNYTAATMGWQSIRYTINKTECPMPVGKLGKGKAPVVIDNTVNQVSGSSAPTLDGAIKFLKDGQAAISKTYLVWNETGTDNTVTFWDVLIDVDGNETKIPESEKTFTVKAKSNGTLFTVPAYTVEVEKGQRVGGKANSNIKDGAYIESDGSTQDMLQITIEFDELKP